jgi:uncharacterized Ntn-hydrolase superfamily protein
MRSIAARLGLTCLGALLGPGIAAAAEGQPDEWTATFSIVAHDPATGETGVGVKTRSFRSGARVLWAKVGVGAVVTQATTNLTYGPEGLKLLESGLSPEEVVRRLTEPDSLRAERQMGIVDVRGRAAAYTGSDCWHAASHVMGDGFAVQGNNLESERVVPAMARAFQEAKGELAERMLAALEAGQALGGDGRGYGSAGIRIVKEGYRGVSYDPSHLDPYWVDVRVDYSRDPLKDMHFLLQQTRARRLVTTAQELAKAGKTDEAVQVQEVAVAILPDDEQLQYRLAERYADAGRRDDAIRELRRALIASPALKYAVPRSESFKKILDDPRLSQLLRE